MIGILDKNEFHSNDFQIIVLRQILATIGKMIKDNIDELDVLDICKLVECSMDLSASLSAINSDEIYYRDIHKHHKAEDDYEEDEYLGKINN